jgi:hydrogenase nickel incorporation protein HypB
MGRFHRHDDGTEHDHVHDGPTHSHDGPTHSHDLGDHSSYRTGTERVEVLERIFDENDRCAAQNRR